MESRRRETPSLVAVVQRGEGVRGPLRVFCLLVDEGDQFLVGGGNICCGHLWNMTPEERKSSGIWGEYGDKEDCNMLGGEGMVSEMVYYCYCFSSSPRPLLDKI